MSVRIAEQFDAVRSALLAAEDSDAATQDQRYHKYEGYRSYGIKRDSFTLIMRELRPDLRSLDLEERLELAARLVKTGIEEEASVAVWLLRDSVKKLGPANRDFLDAFAGEMRSWSTTDDFSTHVMRPLLHAHPQSTLALLRHWNRSDERWKQRASVVSLTRRAGDVGEFLDETLQLCEQLIWSEDDLVRKGVGWALRDAMRVDKERVLSYVLELRRRGVSSVVTLYALQDIKGPERQRALSVTKE